MWQKVRLALTAGTVVAATVGGVAAGLDAYHKWRSWSPSRIINEFPDLDVEMARRWPVTQPGCDKNEVFADKARNLDERLDKATDCIVRCARLNGYSPYFSSTVKYINETAGTYVSRDVTATHCVKHVRMLAQCKNRQQLKNILRALFDQQVLYDQQVNSKNKWLPNPVRIMAYAASGDSGHFTVDENEALRQAVISAST